MDAMRTPTRAPAKRAGDVSRRVSEEVRVVLLRKGLEQQDLAEKLDVYDSWLSRRFKGQTPFTVDDLVRIADALEVTPADLVRSTRGLFGVKRRWPGGYAQAALIMPAAA